MEFPSSILNHSVMITMAKIMIKMANGPYSNSFHLDLHKDFNEDAPDAVVLLPSSEEEKGSSDSERGDRMGVVVGKRDRRAESRVFAFLHSQGVRFGSGEGRGRYSVSKGPRIQSPRGMQTAR
jgi:hypothetical protein